MIIPKPENEGIEIIGASPDAPLIADYEKALKIEKAGNIEKAKEIYIKVAFNSKEFYGAHQRLAIIYRKEKDFENELKIILHALYLTAHFWNYSANLIDKMVRDWPVSPEAIQTTEKIQLKVLNRWGYRLEKLLTIREKELNSKRIIPEGKQDVTARG